MSVYSQSADLPWYSGTDRSASRTLSAKPLYADLPIKYGLHHSWNYFGRDDELGTINFLTPEVVAEGAKEIKDGVIISMNLPIQVPSHPSFGRPAAAHTVVTKNPKRPVNDDMLTMNTQSGTQTDGLRHFGCFEGNCFYNDTPNEAIKRGALDFDNPLDIKQEDIKLGIHNWQSHGIAGRGVLIDMVSWYTRNVDQLPYDPWKKHAVPLDDIKACAAHQGVKFRHGDHLIIRMGFTQKYWNATTEEKKVITCAPGQQFAGIDGSESTAEWIWNNGFASVSSDQPAFEAWEPVGVYLHERLICGLGMPIGEFYDLERLSEVCKQKKRYTFYYSSNLLNLLSGCASPANATATF